MEYHTANLRTKILDLRGFDPSIISIVGGGILMLIVRFPEMLSREVFVGIVNISREIGCTLVTVCLSVTRLACSGALSRHMLKYRGLAY